MFLSESSAYLMGYTPRVREPESSCSNCGIAFPRLELTYIPTAFDIRCLKLSLVVEPSVFVTYIPAVSQKPIANHLAPSA